MDFYSVIVFLVLYYLRPQEWIGAFASLRPVLVVMVVALAAMFMRDHAPRLRDFFRTPHDWVMYAFFAWLVMVSPPQSETFGEVKSLLVFYIVVVQALSDWKRLEVFLRWWVCMMLVVAVLAAGVVHGFDPTGAYDRTMGVMQGRVVLGMSIFNNPNALAHSLVPLVPMLYYLAMWRRAIFTKEASLFLFPLPLYAIYLAQSKGGYLSAGATFLASSIFGRARVVQVILLVLALQLGTTGIYMLPRMDVLKSGKMSAKDEGVLGRIWAFQYGLHTMNTLRTGVGYRHFVPSIMADTGFSKSSHSSYVCVGAELGKTGLALYLAVLYCSLRTLLTARCKTIRQGRIRRALFAAIFAFMASSWLVNFEYRAVFFFQAAAVAAFHRLLLRDTAEKKDTEGDDGPDPLPGEEPAPSLLPAPMPANIPVTVIGSAGAADGVLRQPELPPRPSPATVLLGKQADTTPADPDDDALDEGAKAGIYRNWNRLTLVDLALVLALYKATVMLWTWAVLHL